MTMAGGMSYTVPTALNGSVQFNGTTQYLSTTGATSDAIDLAAGAGDWTVELWFYLNSVAGTITLFEKGGATGTTNPSYVFSIISGTGQWLIGDGGTGAPAIQNVSITWAANTWYHFALVRNGSTMTAYINGVGQTPVSIVGTMSNTSNNVLAIGHASDGATNFVNGYISNFRITKGVAVYTSNFTPSTGPLTSTQAANVNGNPSAAITGTQTSLLLSTPNNASFITNTSSFSYTMTNNGTSTSSPINPFSPGSILLNGTSQYLTVPNNVAFTFGTGDFTVEAWIYPISVAAGANQFTIISFGNNVLSLYISAGLLYYYDTNTGGPGNVAGGTVVINQWQHIAVTRSGTFVKCFINGVQTISTTSSSNITSGTNYIGFNGGSYPWGYISNLRVVKGVAVYTGAFTPPTTPLTAVTNTQLLLDVASSGAYLTDSSTNNFTLTPTGTVTYNASTPVSSGGSLFFDQTTISYLTVPSSTAFNLTGDFTIQAWIYMTTILGGTNGIFDARVAAQSAAPWAFSVNGSGKLEFFTGSYYTGSTTLSTNVWNHVAAVRTGSTLILYLNGSADYVNTAFGSGAISPGTTSALVGTKDFGINSQFRTVNYITNLQFVNGTALYTRTSFTPPPGPATSTQAANQNGNNTQAITGTQTSLLLNTQNGTNAFIDDSTNGFTVTNVGGATVQSFNPFGLPY
jgi:hypothetical protein